MDIVRHIVHDMLSHTASIIILCLVNTSEYYILQHCIFWDALPNEFFHNVITTLRHI